MVLPLLLSAAGLAVGTLLVVADDPESGDKWAGLGRGLGTALIATTLILAAIIVLSLVLSSRRPFAAVALIGLPILVIVGPNLLRIVWVTLRHPLQPNLSVIIGLVWLIAFVRLSATCESWPTRGKGGKVRPLGTKAN